MRVLILVVALLLATALFPTKIFAATHAASSAALVSDLEIQEEKQDIRILALENTLKKYNSPLAPYASVYISEADKNGVDWKLLPSIAGLESTFGKHYIEGTYNVYGWGSGRIYFESWEDGIATINVSLKTRYIDRGATDVWKIGPIYAESPTWAVRVNYFMGKIDEEYLALVTQESLKPNL